MFSVRTPSSIAFDIGANAGQFDAHVPQSLLHLVVVRLGCRPLRLLVVETGLFTIGVGLYLTATTLATGSARGARTAW